MSWKKILLIAGLIVIIVLMVFKLKTNKEVAQDRVYHFDKDEAFGVSVDTIQPGLLIHDQHYSGTFEPVKETNLNAELQGKINKVSVDVGSVVRQGQALIQLDHSLLDLQVKSIEAEMEGVEADLRRYTALAEADAIQGVKVEKAQLGLKQAQIQKATVEEKIHKSTIRAPFGGVITAKMVEVGAFAAPGMPLLQITNIYQLKFTVNVPEQDLHLFQINKQYTIKADVLPAETLTGKVIMIGAKSNRAHHFPVQFLVSNLPGQKIKAGMFGKVFIENELAEQGISIPASALQGSSEGPQVYVVRDNKAVLQSITIASRYTDQVVVSQGLKEGDLLITDGFINLYDGARVMIHLKNEL